MEERVLKFKILNHANISYSKLKNVIYIYIYIYILHLKEVLLLPGNSFRGKFQFCREKGAEWCFLLPSRSRDL